MDVVDKLKRGEPPSNPDRIISMKVAADTKSRGSDGCSGARLRCRQRANRSCRPGASAPALVADAAVACSVLSGHPCHPSFCSVFHRGPCLPYYMPPIGEDLRLTIVSTDSTVRRAIFRDAANSAAGRRCSREQAARFDQRDVRRVARLLGAAAEG